MEDPNDGVSVIWRRVDMPGHEAVRIYEGDEGWYVDGAAVFSFEGKPCRLEYLIECDPDWNTSFATVDGFVGEEVIAIEIESEDGVWYLNGEEIGEVEGCTDIDLNFSPVTNLLPIKRLNLEVGGAETVRAAWLRFPSFSLESLEQVYTRKSESVFNYRSTTGFEKDIAVDEFGVVVEYPDLWVRES
jgi:uncharacterized protein